MNGHVFQCPLCTFEALPSAFVSIDGRRMRCPRCRGEFTDPNAYDAALAYADCDNPLPATRCPYQYGNRATVVNVRRNYLALVIDSEGNRQWLEEGRSTLPPSPGNLQLYFICLSPQIMWGAAVETFGAYGKAQLSLSKDFVKQFCKTRIPVPALEDHVHRLVSQHIQERLQYEEESRRLTFYEFADAYAGLTGNVARGLQLTGVEALGYQTADGRNVAFPASAAAAPADEQHLAAPPEKPPVDIARPPARSYVVADRAEDIFFRGRDRPERHKAGETITEAMLHGVDKLIHFHRKEFTLTNGWGVYNQPLTGTQYLSAHGDVSFYVDSTLHLSSHLYDVASWRVFEEHLFTGVLRSLLGDALKTLISSRAGSGITNNENISAHLSSLSIDLTQLLNGEGPHAGEPMLRKYGLRVRTTDILGMTFYPDRR